VAVQLLDDSDGVIRGKAACVTTGAKAFDASPTAASKCWAFTWRNQKGGLVNEVVTFDGPLVTQGHGTYLDNDTNPAGATSR
jgi:hypothetical protein